MVYRRTAEIVQNLALGGDSADKSDNSSIPASRFGFKNTNLLVGVFKLKDVIYCVGK